MAYPNSNSNAVEVNQNTENSLVRRWPITAVHKYLHTRYPPLTEGRENAMQSLVYTLGEKIQQKPQSGVTSTFITL